jgi:hypothetical protein
MFEKLAVKLEKTVFVLCFARVRFTVHETDVPIKHEENPFEISIYFIFIAVFSSIVIFIHKMVMMYHCTRNSPKKNICSVQILVSALDHAILPRTIIDG